MSTTAPATPARASTRDCLGDTLRAPTAGTTIENWNRWSAGIENRVCSADAYVTSWAAIACATRGAVVLLSARATTGISNEFTGTSTVTAPATSPGFTPTSRATGPTSGAVFASPAYFV